MLHVIVEFSVANFVSVLKLYKKESQALHSFVVERNEAISPTTTFNHACSAFALFLSLLFLFSFSLSFSLSLSLVAAAWDSFFFNFRIFEDGDITDGLHHAVFERFPPRPRSRVVVVVVVVVAFVAFSRRRSWRRRTPVVAIGKARWNLVVVVVSDAPGVSMAISRSKAHSLLLLLLLLVVVLLAVVSRSGELFSPSSSSSSLLRLPTTSIGA